MKLKELLHCKMGGRIYRTVISVRMKKFLNKKNDGQ